MRPRGNPELGIAIVIAVVVIGIFLIALIGDAVQKHYEVEAMKATNSVPKVSK